MRMLGLGKQRAGASSADQRILTECLSNFKYLAVNNYVIDPFSVFIVLVVFHNLSCANCSYTTEHRRLSKLLAQDQCLGSCSRLRHDIESVSTSISDNLINFNPEKR